MTNREDDQHKMKKRGKFLHKSLAGKTFLSIFRILRVHFPIEAQFSGFKDVFPFQYENLKKIRGNRFFANRFDGDISVTVQTVYLLSVLMPCLFDGNSVQVCDVLKAFLRSNMKNFGPVFLMSMLGLCDDPVSISWWRRNSE